MFKLCDTRQQLNDKHSETLLVLVVVVVIAFYIALFSAVEQTHCALSACDSEWVTVSFFLTRILFFFLLIIHGSGILIALFGCCMAGAT